MSRLKFTIHGFQQQKLIEHGLDNNDALVMAVVRDMYSSISVEHKIIDGDRYIWVNQTALSEYVPIIGVLKTFQRIFKKLTEAGVFESRIVNGRNGKTGKYFYLKPSKLLEDLTEYVAVTQENDQETKSPLIKGQKVLSSEDKKSFDHGTNCPNKDTPTNDSSTNDSKEGEGKPSLSSGDDPANASSVKKQIEIIVDEWNKSAPNRVVAVTSGSTRDTQLRARLKQFTVDEFIEAIRTIPFSPFLLGQNSRGWVIKFDWFIKPSNFQKVLEGNYVGERKGVNNHAGNSNNHVPYGIQAQEQFARDARDAYARSRYDNDDPL